MKFEIALLVGGSRNGERLSVVDGVTEMRMAATLDGLAAGGEIYRRVHMRSEKGVYLCVFVHGDIDVMQTLIDGYQPFQNMTA